MKKTFIVEVEYNELEENRKNNSDVFYDTALEVAIENLMEGYIETNSIRGEYTVNVREINFYQLFKNGNVSKNQIHDFIDKWNNSDDECELYEYLGLTKEQYNTWVETDTLI